MNFPINVQRRVVIKIVENKIRFEIRFPLLDDFFFFVKIVRNINTRRNLISIFNEKGNIYWFDSTIIIGFNIIMSEDVSGMWFLLDEYISRL